MARGHAYRRRLSDGRISKWHAVIDPVRGGDGRRRQSISALGMGIGAHARRTQAAVDATTTHAGSCPLPADQLTDRQGGQAILRPSAGPCFTWERPVTS